MKELLSRIEEAVRAVGPNAPLRVYLAGHDREGHPIPTRRLTAFEWELTEIAGGSTTIRAVGRWKDGDGQTPPEPVRIVEIHFAEPLTLDPQKRLVRCLAGILLSTEQKVLAIAVNGRMIFIPRPAQLGDDEELELAG